MEDISFWEAHSSGIRKLAIHPSIQDVSHQAQPHLAFFFFAGEISQSVSIRMTRLDLSSLRRALSLSLSCISFVSRL